MELLSAVGQMAPALFESKHMWAHRLKKNMTRPQYERGIKNLSKQGLVKIVSKNDLRFIQLTKRGELRILLSKAKDVPKQKWDGKWRLVIFDIPESSEYQRQIFRKLLKINGFYKLQGSVYINPYPLNASAITYLRETGLIDYIGMIRADKVDREDKLKKHFKLS